MKVKVGILLPDIHHPHHSKPCLNLVNQLIKDIKPDYLIYQGDQLNMDTLCHWNEDKQREMEGKRLLSEYEAFDREILKPHEKLTGPKCKKVWLIGNHEYWVEKYLDNHPGFEGIIEPENYLKLKARGFEIIKFNDIYKIGKLNVIHGYYTNQYHAAKTVTAFEGNVVYAHAHTSQEFTKTTPRDIKDFHSATSLPCLCDLNPDYMKNRPSSWVNGFGVVYVLPNGNFNLYRVIIADNSFVFNGKHYVTNKNKKTAL